MPAQDPPRDSVAANIKFARKARGLTQVQLERAANVSASMIRKVEAGHRPPSPAFIAAVARALGTSAADLMGQPYAPANRDEGQVHAVVPLLRRELVGYKLAPGDGVRPRSITQLRRAVNQASRLRHAVQLDKLGIELPGLLEELRAAAFQAAPPEAEHLFGLLAEAYYATDQVLSKLGYTDLASTAVDRYEWAAAQSGDELAVLVGDYRRAGELIGAADWAGAQRLLADSRAHLEPRLGSAPPEVWSTWGNLHLKSGLAAARAGDGVTADAHWAEAQEAAVHTGERDDYRLAFGPTNVDIWGVGLAVERCDGTLAVTRASTVVLPPGTPRERSGHHFIDLARGYQLHGNREASLRALNKARRLSPQQTRLHPQVRETVFTLAEQDRRTTQSLSSFARWAHITL